jgi:hypothetical protein
VSELNCQLLGLEFLVRKFFDEEEETGAGAGL